LFPAGHSAANALFSLNIVAPDNSIKATTAGGAAPENFIDNLSVTKGGIIEFGVDYRWLAL